MLVSEDNTEGINSLRVAERIRGTIKFWAETGGMKLIWRRHVERIMLILHKWNEVIQTQIDWNETDEMQQQVDFSDRMMRIERNDIVWFVK